MNMLNPADSAPFPSELELRRQLREAQDARKLADAKASRAKEVSDHAETLMCEAKATAERLQSELDQGARSATEKRSRAICEALRAGLPPPPDPMPTEASSAPLTAALATFHAYKQSAAELAMERDNAQVEAAAASTAVTSLIDALTDLLAAEVARDFIEAQRRADHKWDVLNGILKIDEARVGKAGFYWSQREGCDNAR